MKSGKQRRAEIIEHRRAHAAKAAVKTKADPRGTASPPKMGSAPCNPALLLPSNSYSAPTFVVRGYYLDLPFTCVGCNSEEVWRATQQKWWYEVAKGNIETRAIRCRNCRRVERERSNEARRVHLEGIEKRNKDHAADGAN